MATCSSTSRPARSSGRSSWRLRHRLSSRSAVLVTTARSTDRRSPRQSLEPSAGSTTTSAGGRSPFWKMDGCPSRIPTSGCGRFRSSWRGRVWPTGRIATLCRVRSRSSTPHRDSSSNRPTSIRHSWRSWRSTRARSTSFTRLRAGPTISSGSGILNGSTPRATTDGWSCSRPRSTAFSPGPTRRRRRHSTALPSDRPSCAASRQRCLRA